LVLDCSFFATYMDPFWTYSSRRSISGRGGEDTYPNGPEDLDPALLVLTSSGPDWIQFDVNIEKVTVASPFIKSIWEHNNFPRKMAVSATPDQLQLFIKYLYTGVYDPAEVSHRYRDKFQVVYGQFEFYMFCVKIEYNALTEMVRVGIQSALDVLSWSRMPDMDDTVVYPMGGPCAGIEGTLLIGLFDEGERYYKQLRSDDPLKQSLLRYLVNLWRIYGSSFLEDRVDAYMTQASPELWKAMQDYKARVPVDVYESWAPKYSRHARNSSWLSSLFGR